MSKAYLSGYRIANIRGVDLKIHFSLVFLLIYTIIVATAQFPFVLKHSGINPTGISGSPLIWGVVFSIGLFLSVVIHEFAHVIVAQSMGVRVAGITLMMLGGVSEMERIPEKPYAEFKVAVVGPITSLALAGILFAIHSKALSPNLSFLTYWLSQVNLVLGVFNLVPAFPLDGGRAFRSILSVKQGSVHATRTAVGVARGLAWVLGIWGFLSFNFLLMLIATFIYSSATGELVLSGGRGILRKITARDAMILVPPVSENQNLMSVAESMMRTRVRVLPVQTSTLQPAVVSIESLRLIAKERWNDVRVREVMEQVSRFLEEDEALDDSLSDLAACEALPVQKDGQIIGLVRYAEIFEILELKSLFDEEKRREVA